jgi:septal ring factor EnvC (AmiA/AmiB activator)
MKKEKQMDSRRVFCGLLLVVMVFGASNAQTTMSKDEWQKEMQDNTTLRADLNQQLASLNRDINDLRHQLASLDQQIQSTKDATMAMSGATAAMRHDFEQQLNTLESTVDNLTRMSDADLAAHYGDVEKAQEQDAALTKQKIAAIAEYHRRLQAIQHKLDGLKNAIAQQTIEAKHEKVYVVKTWAKDRDCLWNIAKKPSVYDNAFLWTKIFEGNRDQIKDPNLIYPHERLKIPPAGPLASVEGSRRMKTMAHRSHK